MRRPWQIWLVFSLGLTVAFFAMGWLSMKALDLEREREQSRVEAEMEEDVRQALWHADSLIMPILAQESAWPHYAYRPYYSSGKSKSEPIPSPLLTPTNDLVLLNFELGPDNQLVSPQVPPDKMQDWAVHNGTCVETMDAARGRLAELKTTLQHADLLMALPLEQPITLNLPQQANPTNYYLTFNNTYTGNTTIPNGTVVLPNGPAQVPLQVEPTNASFNSGGEDGLNGKLTQTNNDNSGGQQDNTNAGSNSNAGSPPVKGRGNTLNQQSKNELDLALRSQAYSQQGQNAAVQQQRLAANNKDINEGTLLTSNLREGLAKAIWVNSSLIFARRLTIDNKVYVQGCLLDWDKLRNFLTSETHATALADGDRDSLAQAEWVPVASSQEETRGRMLATLPVKLSVPDALFVPTTWYTPIRFSLLVAWGCALLGAVAVAALLFGVVTLSERRGAFVSAVTHELRTPLTTFRMYAEMLAEDMVHDPQQQKHYLQTLRAEADRLTHLVGNVLAYARLERGKLSERVKELSLGDLIQHARGRLADRAQQASLEFVEEIDEPLIEQTVLADSAAVEQILFNLVDNAAKYAASATDRRIHLTAEVTSQAVLLRIRDHGPGVNAQEAKRLFQPFRKSAKDAANSAPGVGLGLALSRRLARDLGGDLVSEGQHSKDAPNLGACFVLRLRRGTK